MKSILSIACLCLFTGLSVFSQELNHAELDAYFNSLEERNEAMGSLTLSKNGKLIYQRAFGKSYIQGDEERAADANTHYRIWSITKTYTATMVLQLVEEGKLSLETRLKDFYPQIPHAEKITIEQMLRHRSGIHDFIQNDTEEEWDTYIDEPRDEAFMLPHIAEYAPDFEPDEDFRYSNSNYLLLGYIIGRLDSGNYESSLAKRIAAKAELRDTYFKVEGLDDLENKAYSYRWEGEWNEVDEGSFSGNIPGGAGGIVSTTADLNKFIEALFGGKLLSDSSLKKMMEAEGFYGLGLMQMADELGKGFGHTGGNIASESSLFYYPDDSLSIAYCSNGILIWKGEILRNVRKIYLGQAFGISMNRELQAFFILGFISLLFGLIYIRGKWRDRSMLLCGYFFVALLWGGTFIGGYLAGAYDHIREGIGSLEAFYSSSGTFMGGLNFLLAGLMALLFISLYRIGKRSGISSIPLFPLLLVTISMAGSSLFPHPHKLYTLFANIIVFSALGPLLALILWRKKELRQMRLISMISLILMLVSFGVLLSRSSNPQFVAEYFGLIQRILYLGLSLWVIGVSLTFAKHSQ
ncbi:MAG: serine hydrolase [Bacteroidia bacterium]|nr:serine hydrolase [Bacteroidia bacterium]